MISVTGKLWKQKKINRNSIEKVKQDHDFSEILSKLIITRKFDQTEIYSIDNDLDLTNVFTKNNDFTASINLLSIVIKNKENIFILGDYDVDGSAATSLLIRYLERLVT